MSSDAPLSISLSEDVAVTPAVGDGKASKKRAWLDNLLDNRGFVVEPVSRKAGTYTLRSRDFLKAKYGPSYWDLYGRDDEGSAMRLLRTRLVTRANERLAAAIGIPMPALDMSIKDPLMRLRKRFEELSSRCLAHDVVLRSEGKVGLSDATLRIANTTGCFEEDADDDDENIVVAPRRPKRAKREDATEAPSTAVDPTSVPEGDVSDDDSVQDSTSDESGDESDDESSEESFVVDDDSVSSGSGEDDDDSADEDASTGDSAASSIDLRGAPNTPPG